MKSRYDILFSKHSSFVSLVFLDMSICERLFLAQEIVVSSWLFDTSSCVS